MWVDRKCFMIRLRLIIPHSLPAIAQTITDSSIRNVAMRCVNLRQLCVSKCGELTDSTLVALANFNPHLSTLEVAGCHQFTDIGFQALGKVKKVLRKRFEQQTWKVFLLVELQVFGTNGSGRVQSDNGSNASALGHRMSQPGKTCSLTFKANLWV